MPRFQLQDRYEIDAAANLHETNDGYMVATPRVARTGIQLYYGSELGLTGDDAKKVMRVYRPEDQVFNTDSMATFAHKPLTDDHPPVPVNAKNWSTYGKGQLGDEVARDGNFIRVPMVMMDAGLIGKVKDGKAELSVGYACDIEIGSGTTADGEAFDATQKNIAVNHVAVVKNARGGAALKIGDGSGMALDFAAYSQALAAVIKGNTNRDGVLAGGNGFLAKDAKYPVMLDGVVFVDSLRAAKTDAIARNDGDIKAAADNLLIALEGKPNAVVDGKPVETKRMKTMQIDGITVEVGDGNASEVIGKHIAQLTTSVADMTTKLSTQATDHAKAIAAKDEVIAKLTTDLSTATTKVTTLEASVKDAEMTPAKLDALVADRAIKMAKGKALLGDKLVVDGKTDAEIMRQVVDAKLGDAAKGWSDDQIKISFDTLTATIDTKSVQSTTHQPGGAQQLADAFKNNPGSTQRSTADAALDARNARLQDAWKTPAHKVA